MGVPRVMLGADSLQRGGSGIGRVARLMARLLGDEMRAGTLHAEAVVLHDATAADDLGIPVRTVRGSQVRFALEIHRAALRSSHFMYDFAGIARAHPRLAGLRRPYLVWMHGIEAWEDARRDRLRCLRRADVLVANTAFTRERASGLHPGLDRARTCWLGTEEDSAAPVRPRPDAPAVLILARLDRDGGYKGHRELIACWPRVVSAMPAARLLIAGSGPGQAIIGSWVQASPVRDRIELLGFVPEAALPELWGRARVFAMPSRGEGFGLAYVEAMRHGLPVVASIHDAAVEVNLDGETGFNVNLNTQDALPQRLIALLQDDALATRLGDAARERWARHFGHAAFRARFRPHLQRLLAC
jgi:phosphatidylinositol alpha-1,6-mannosyltransferase